MTLRIVQVGMGGWGQNWAKDVVARNKDVETVAWVDVHAETLKNAQERLKLPAALCFSSLTSALEAVDADAVLITASLPGHVPSALEALNAGKHVLIEKPFAPSIEEAQQVVEAAAQRGLMLMVSQNYRYYPAVRVVADLVRRNVLGAVGSVNIDFRRYDNLHPFEASNHYKIWEPLLVDMSIHHFDLMRMVLGQEPQEIVCKTWNPPGSKYLEAAAGAAVITFDGGAVVSYRGNWVSPAPKTNWAGEWHMECEQGEIVWTSRGDLPDSVVLRPYGEPEQIIELPEYPLRDRNGSLAAFVEAVRTGIEPECSGARNLNTLALMFAAVEAAATNLPVALPTRQM
jgi:predicted dehydrogenase